jgi:hypothetical protein
MNRFIVNDPYLSFLTQIFITNIYSLSILVGSFNAGGLTFFESLKS